MMGNKPTNEAGFTLIEVMAALGVLSIALIGLIGLTTEQTRLSGDLTNRTYAMIVAENQLIVREIDPTPLTVGVTRGTVELVGQDWTWEQTVMPTDIVGLFRIEMRVRHAEGNTVLAQLEALEGAS